ncbi:hypothetical protein BV20DRAFT_973042 [Pilatotrama ljubarskyi]|nr:hypothetical protein BV20DRAFT_973042 [Pilatotrama ljubarskyi]
MAARRGGYRTKLCRNFALGHCPQGEACNYIHASPATIQSDLNIHTRLGSGSRIGHEPQVHLATTASPVWSTLSPTTNCSDHPNYQWGSSPVSGPAPASRIKYRPLSYRTALCRHFVRNKGWCPLGDECNYIHDLALAEFAQDDVRFDGRRTVGSGGGRLGGKSGKAGTKHSHCWAYVQGLCHVQDCQYLHPVAVHLFAPHTPCLAWPNCRRGPLCPYKHPEPYVSDSTPPSPKPNSPIETNPPPTAQPDPVPRGAISYNGMLYYNNQQPQQAQAMPSLNLPPPAQQASMLFTNPWDVWRLSYPQTPMTYMPVVFSPPPGPPWPDTSFRWPDIAMPSAPPAMPRLPTPPFDTQRPGAPLQAANIPSEPLVEHSRVRSRPVSEHELPYVPPKQPQQVGHARRVSVTIKGKEDLDALALDSSSRVRQPWQTHGDRLGRRSWAPSSSSVHATGAHTPTSVFYGM